MSKFTLLTTLTLQAAGFNQGIDKAKKGAKALSDGVKTAGTTMSTAFAPLQGILGGLGGQLSGLSNVALGGVSAFKSMIPAITGIKTALISTGIGAIVVALGTAFAALTSYMKGTEAGANKLQIVMGYIKGAFNAILVRVQLLGESISLVFEGKFKEAGEKLKEAFAGGLLQEIKDDAKEAVGYSERENKLWRDNLNLKKRESEVQAEINQLKLIAWNNTGEVDAVTRQKALNRAKELELGITSEKIRLAKEEYDIVKSQNAMGNNSRADTEKEVDLYVQINNIKSEYLSKQKEYLEKQIQINNALKANQDVKRETGIDVSKISGAFTEVTATIKSQIPEIQNTLASVKPAEMLSADKLAPFIDNLSYLKLKFKETMDEMKKDSTTTGQVLFGAISMSIKSLSDSLIQGADNFKEYGKNIKSVVKQIIGAFIAEGVAALVKNALESAATTPYGFLMAAPLAALAGGIAKTAFNSLLPKFHTGGIVGGISEVAAVLKPREMVLTTAQQSNLYNMINRNNGVGTGEVVFRIDGTQLIGVLDNYSRRVNSYR